MGAAVLDKLKKRGLLVSWPVFGCGNSLIRVISHHAPYYYKPDWNPWGSDRGPLDPPSDDGAIETDYYPAKRMRSVVHIGCLLDIEDGWVTRGPIWPQIKRAAAVNKRDFLEWNKTDQRVIIPVFHTPASVVTDLVPDMQIVQLYFKSIDTINQRWPKARPAKLKANSCFSEDGCVKSPQVCNISIEDFFFSDYNNFKLEFERLSTFCGFTSPDIERARQWVLYYRDRIDRYLPQDKEEWAKGELNVKTTKR